MREALVGPTLPAEVLARRHTLPLKVAPVRLTGQVVRLQPLDLERHVAALFAITNGQSAQLNERTIGPYDADALVWRYLVAPHGTVIRPLVPESVAA